MEFSSKKIFMANPSFIPAVAAELSTQFQAEGYSVKVENLVAGGADISITKGGFFKTIAGMKTALKITLTPEGTYIFAEAGVGIFGQQAIPTIISLFVFWPVLLTQIWGMVQQNKLDDHAMELIEKALQKLTMARQNVVSGNFCPECGASASGNFCSSCGKKLK